MPKAPKWINDALESLMASKMRLITVTETSYISPVIKKIRFKGNLLGLNFQLGYAIAIRVSDTEFRNYTASFCDTEKGILEVIVHLHGIAPGSLFMNNLKVGDEIRITIPRGKKMYDETAEKQLFFGDETSLGLSYAFYPTLLQNYHQYHFYFELEEENRNIPKLLDLDNYTVFPKKSPYLTDQLIKSLPISQISAWQSVNFILTGNAKSIQTIKKKLKENNIPCKIIYQAYWAEGKTGL